jgi:hypothetical protein
MFRITLYLLCFLFISDTVTAQLSNEAVSKKMAPGLFNRLQERSASDSIDLYISYKEAIDTKGGRIINSYAPGNIAVIRMPVIKVINVIQQKQVLFAEVYEKPKEELTTGTLDLATNKSNLSHYAFPDITGENIALSVKENKPDTTDLDYAGRYFNSGISSSIYSPHASIMATTIAGAGNTSSFSKGVAQRSKITSSNFASLLPDPDAIFKGYDITVQNHSYGTTIQNYYGAEAMAYDVSAINNPELLHVFSSGNSGTAKGTEIYSAISGYANLTGNFKMAKNSITVGAIDSFYNIAAASSKGPAYDGRVKPELVAFGEDGSSGAAAMVSGSAALVQQAYQQKYGKLPFSSTTKAILINSASEAGVNGIDFSSGFGSLNTYAAVQTVQQGRVMEDVLSSNQTKSFLIQVPANVAKLKVTLIWTDPAAVTNAPKALVNDLNLTVISSSNSSWLPWVLDHSPHIDSLQSAAVRKPDTLNTVEQVTIEAPEAGTYTINISAGLLSINEQAFSIAYQVDTLEQLYWSYPTAIDQIEAGVFNVIRWETNTTGKAVLEYSTDKINWQPVASLPDVSIGYYQWLVPAVTTTAWLRLQSGSRSIISDTFVISSIPRMDVGFNCTDSFLLYWNKQPVTQYQLYHLPDNYLQPLAQVIDSFSLLQKAQHPALYYSVASVVKGKVGLRSAILNYAAQGVECYFKSFYLQTQNERTASFSSSIGSTYGVNALALQKLQNNSFTTLQTFSQPQTTEQVFTDPSLQQGINQYRLAIQLTNGKTIYSEVVPIYYFNNQNVIIFPNPANQKDAIHILASRAGRTSIHIYNTSGALIKQLRLKDLQQQIPPLQLNKGLYFIKIIDEEQGAVSTQKLVVQ